MIRILHLGAVARPGSLPRYRVPAAPQKHATTMRHPGHDLNRMMRSKLEHTLKPGGALVVHNPSSELVPI